MNKILTIAALALMLSACSNEDNDIQTPVEQPAKSEGIPFTATISIGESAMTRALTEDATNNQIVPTWVAGEKVALIHNGVNDEMSVASVSGGVATITGTITGTPTTGDAVTIIYPSTAADGTTGNVKANLLAAQDGTLATIAANYDVRKGTGTLKVSGTASLNGNVSLTNQFAIWKLTLGNAAKNLCIMADNMTIAGATLATAGTQFYVAVPAVSSKTITIVANDESKNCSYYSKAGVSLTKGYYYQSSPSMTTLDTDGSKDVFKIAGTVSSNVTIPDGKTVVLSDVTMSNNSITCSGNANIILMGSNTVSAASSSYLPAIQIGGTGTTLTIQGSGSLTAIGSAYASGIGTGWAKGATVTGGNIIINVGTITATGGERAAGIGTGNAYIGSNECGAITITGGTVNATAGTNGAGIGTGRVNGGGANTCGAITITGGTVIATGDNGGAGIGTGNATSATGTTGSNTCGDISIAADVTSVTATKGSGSPNSIGKGNISFIGGTVSQNCGTITFGTAQVFDGTAATGTWTPNPMVADTYGGLNLAISTTTTTDDTWILTPVAP